MAAQEDNESHQEFPAALFAVPSRTELEERLVLALNTKDGQQACAQDDADPYTRAVRYVEQHRIVEIFQVVSMETKPGFSPQQFTQYHGSAERCSKLTWGAS